MRPKILIAVLLPVLLTCSARLTLAGIVYDSGGYSAGGGFIASDFSFPNQVSAAFVASSSNYSTGAYLNQFRWWGGYRSGQRQGPDNFTVRLFQGSATDPLVEFDTSNLVVTDTGVDSFGWSIYEYTLDVTPFYIPHSTQFRFSTVNNMPGNDWNWNRTNRFTGTHFRRSQDGNSWTTYTDSKMAFQVSGYSAVPEPSSLLLTGLVAPMLLLRRRRRSQYYAVTKP